MDMHVFLLLCLPPDSSFIMIPYLHMEVTLFILLQGFCESIFLSSIGRTIGTSLQSFYRRLKL
ncbi:hypothetical protein EJD97_011186 [Solanum chilense]|nr:hypothetical protein EJD97_011186 [Solanum chilense]